MDRGITTYRLPLQTADYALNKGNLRLDTISTLSVSNLNFMETWHLDWRLLCLSCI